MNFSKLKEGARAALDAIEPIPCKSPTCNGIVPRGAVECPWCLADAPAESKDWWGK